jgi:hypothetical protein
MLGGGLGGWLASRPRAESEAEMSMRRSFRTYLLTAAALVGAGGLAPALIAQGSAAAPSGRHRADALATAASRARFTKNLVSYLKRTGPDRAARDG